MEYLQYILIISFLHAHLPHPTYSKKILSFEIFGAESHALAYLPWLEALHKLGGHEITVVAPIRNVSKEGIRRHIFTVGREEVIQAAKHGSLSGIMGKVSYTHPLLKYYQIMPHFCSQLYNRPDIQSLLSETFDLVIFHPLFNDCALGLIYRIILQSNAPLILYTPMSLPTFLAGATGGHYPPSFVQGIFNGDFHPEMSFAERFQNFGHEVVTYCIYTYLYLPLAQEIYREKFGENIPDAKSILSNAALIMSNGHSSVTLPKPNLPNVIEVGGLHLHKPKPLSKVSCLLTYVTLLAFVKVICFI